MEAAPDTPSATLPCLPEELRASIVASLPGHPLIRPTPEGPIIGYLADYTPSDDYKALAPLMNVEIAEAFPLLYNALAAALFRAGRSPVFPNGMSLPVISLSGPIPTTFPSTYLDLSTGLLTFDKPAGACVQFHISHRGSFDAVFS